MVPSFRELLFLHRDVCIRCHSDILAAHFSFIYSFFSLFIHHTNSYRNFWKQDVRLDGVGKIQINPTRPLSQLLTVTRWADHCKWKLTKEFPGRTLWQIVFPKNDHNKIFHSTFFSYNVTLTLLPSSGEVYEPDSLFTLSRHLWLS